MAKEFDYDFKIFQSVIDVNYCQKDLLFYKAKENYGTLAGKRTAILGLTLKPHTEDIREAASLRIIQNLLLEGAEITVYDPTAMPKVEKLFGNKISYSTSYEQSLEDAEAAFIVTEWEEIKNLKFDVIK